MSARLYQLGYVTRDLDVAMATFGERYAISDYLRTAVPYPGAAQPAEVALAFSGDTLVELTQPVAGAEGMFGWALPSDGTAALHHLGYLVDDAAELAALADRYEAEGFDVPVRRSRESGPTVVYVDTRPETGHFSEFVRLEGAGRTLLDRIPRS